MRLKKTIRRLGRPRHILIVVALLTVYAVSAEEVTVVYVDGPVRYLPNAARRESDGHLLEIGDRLTREGVLVLETSAYAEIEGPGSIVRILGPGRFPLLDYFDSSVAARESGMERISERWRSLLFAEGSTSDTVAGVRGDYAGEEAWDLGDPTGDLVAAAEDAWRGGDAETAIALYREALMFDGSAPIRLSLAERLFEVGRAAEALSVIEEMTPSPGEAWYKRHAMVAFVVHAGTDDPEAMTSILTSLDRSAFSIDELQTMEYTLAETLRLDGQHESADQALRRLIAIDSESIPARAARRILSDS
ncbi:MAG: hypothetical protein MI724_01230 [Spirochaetales bacterium]|nr:hypothetical protein [Spirochaetales bacterium]